MKLSVKILFIAATIVTVLVLLMIIISQTPSGNVLMVYSAYFDDRPRNNHSNVTVILVVAKDSIFRSNLIIGCGVGKIVEMENFLAHYNYQEQHTLKKKRNKYRQIVVECYDLAVTNGSRAFVIYKTSPGENGMIVESLRPLMVPAPRIRPTGEYNFTVAVCTKALDSGVTWLPEFVRYQKILGVDHVHLSTRDYFIKDGGLARAMGHFSIRDAVKRGYLSIDIWDDWYGSNNVYQKALMLHHLDCYYRYRGTYDYIFTLDTDDFFTPCIPGKTQLKYYIKEYCYTEPAASCAFMWPWLFPDICGMKGEVGEDGNVTNSLKSMHSKLQEKNMKQKSLYSTRYLLDSTFHDAKCSTCLMPGMKVVNVPEHIAYVAHNRLGTYHWRKTVC